MAIGGPAAKLEHLRFEARNKGREWLDSALQDTRWHEVRELAQAAGLRVRKEMIFLHGVGESQCLALMSGIVCLDVSQGTLLPKEDITVARRRMPVEVLR